MIATEMTLWLMIGVVEVFRDDCTWIADTIF
jgi:hypothetical protein